MIHDFIKLTLLCACALTTLVVFLFALDGFLDVMADPTSCESSAKTLAEIFKC